MVEADGSGGSDSQSPVFRTCKPQVILNTNDRPAATPRPMRILYLALGVFDKGGIARYCRYQIRALRELAGEDNVQVLSLFGPGPNDLEEPFAVNHAGGGLGLGSEAAFFLRAMGVAAVQRAQIVWSSHLRLLPAALALSRRTGAPLVVNIYGRELWGGRLRLLHRSTLPRADLVLSDCHFSAEFAASAYKVAPQRVQVIWGCADLERFAPRERNLELLRQFGIRHHPANRYVLTLGRIDKRARHKGYDRLIDAAAALRQYPNLILLFAGAGDDLERLRQRALAAGLAGRAYFLGAIAEDALCDVYNLCDIFALVSDRGPGRGEGILLTQLEAAACAKPVIVGNEDGAQEAVIHDTTGFVVSPRDPAALSGCLERLLLDERLRLEMGRAARARMQTHFSYEKFRERTRRALEALGSGRAKLTPRRRFRIRTNTYRK